jgi:queuine tRNA-ribosyltransferase
MNKPFSFRVLKIDAGARLGEIATARGIIRTPAFVPVGTAATVKGLTPEQLRQCGVDIVLANTYHLMLRPGAERIAKLGGLHAFMRWNGPILTDSGGFQVMSLAKLREIGEDGVAFQSHIDGTRHFLSPERAVEIQCLLGADMLMQLDECTKLPASREDIGKAVERSLLWAVRSKRAFEHLRERGVARAEQALFGIVQGGTESELRRRSADRLVALNFPGYAIGGLAVGETPSAMLATLETTAPHLPADSPRYLMGVGTPVDLIESVARGMDMFDCVLPTRAGRHGHAYTWSGRLNLRNARHAEDLSPLDPESACPAARDYSRAYLHHLVRCEELLGAVLLSWANTAFYQELMQAMRTAIAEGRFAAWAATTKGRLAAANDGDIGR